MKVDYRIRQKCECLSSYPQKLAFVQKIGMKASDSCLSDPLNVRVRRCLIGFLQAIDILVAEADLQSLAEGKCSTFLNFWLAVSSPMDRKFPLYSALLHNVLHLLEEGNKTFLESFSTQPFSFNCDGECACGTTAVGIWFGTSKSSTYSFSCQPTSNRVTADRWSFQGIMEWVPSILTAPILMGHPGLQMGVWLLPQNVHSGCS